MQSDNTRQYQQFIAGMSGLARAALPAFGFSAQAGITLLSHSENTVFKITDAQRNPHQPWSAMRIHRPDYQTEEAIQSELDWMHALQHAGVPTPTAIAGQNGALIQQTGIDTPAGRMQRSVTMFAWLDGEPPEEPTLTLSLRTLGRLSAKMHRQARDWVRPAYFQRLRWDHASTIGPHAHWGRWHDAPGLTAPDQITLQECTTLIGARLAAFGQSPDRFGLIHADMRMANILVAGEHTTVIDFDDCGFGYFLHDMASTLSFIEHRADRARLMDIWADGYSDVQSLSETERAEFPTFLMQRRLQLLAWMASHRETALAQSLGSAWVAESASLGRDYLRSMA